MQPPQKKVLLCLFDCNYSNGSNVFFKDMLHQSLLSYSFFFSSLFPPVNIHYWLLVTIVLQSIQQKNYSMSKISILKPWFYKEGI